MWIIKLHQKYLFNKINLIILFVLMVLSIILGIILINPFMSDNIRWMYRGAFRSNFEQSYLVFLKILIVLFSSYLYTICFSNTSDNYSIILVSKITKAKYFITKVLSINLMLLITIMIFLINYVIIGYFFSTWFYFELRILKNFFNIYLIGLCYGYLSIILIRSIKSIYIVLISFSLYLLSEILIDYVNINIMVKLLEVFFPTTYIINDSTELVYGSLHLFILSFLYFVFSFIIYKKIKE